MQLVVRKSFSDFMACRIFMFYKTTINYKVLIVSEEYHWWLRRLLYMAAVSISITTISICSKS